jgi:N-methylhydantoinase A
MAKIIGVDVGGTFTDVVAVSGGIISTVKVSTEIHDTDRGILEGAMEVGVADAAIFNHASTHGLNAVITRRLPKVGFLTTLGHRDLLDGGRVFRPAAALTDPHWRRSFGDAAQPLVPRYLRRGIRERIGADGGIVIGLDEEQARSELRVLKRCKIQGVASSTEIILARLDAGLRDRAFTGTLNYANCAARLLPVEAAMERPFEIVFAGPAAGTMASTHFGARIGVDNMICADVGRGGKIPATTDTYLRMGVLDPDGFAAGRLRLDPKLSRQAFERLDTKLAFDQRVRYAFRVGINNIAEGVLNMCVRYGIDCAHVRHTDLRLGEW